MGAWNGVFTALAPLSPIALVCSGFVLACSGKEPSTAGGSGGAASLAGGDSGGAQGGLHSNTHPALGGGAFEAGAGAGTVFCKAYERCSLDQLCDNDRSCISIPGCTEGAICIRDGFCQQWCAGECAYLLSYPGQIACSTGQVRGTE